VKNVQCGVDILNAAQNNAIVGAAMMNITSCSYNYF